MSLWTPSGEHPVGDEGRTPGGRGPLPGPAGGPAAGTAAGARTPGGGGPPGDAPGGEGGEDQAALDELRRQLADAPAEVVVANHCYGLFELAAVYLSQVPPRLDQAQVAIDALGHIVEGLGERLGEAHGPLRDALAQVRLAYVQLGTVASEQAESSPQAGDGQG